MSGIIKFGWVLEALKVLLEGEPKNFLWNFVNLIKAIERAI